jgi:hypothetical protein
MQDSPDVNPIFSEGILNNADERSQQTGGRAYECLTIAAMVLLLVSLWVF